LLPRPPACAASGLCGSLRPGVLPGRVEHGLHALLPALDHAAILVDEDHHTIAGDLAGTVVQDGVLGQYQRALRLLEDRTPAPGPAGALVDAYVAQGHDLLHPARVC